MAFVPLQTRRLTLRALNSIDVHAVFAILGHQPTTAAVSFGLSSVSEVEQ